MGEPIPSDAMKIPIGEGERRQPVYLLLDTSQDGAPIEAVRRRVEQFRLELQGDTFLLETVWVGIITFGGRAEFVTKGLVPIQQLVLPPLTAGGQNVLGEALKLLDQSLEQDIRLPTEGGPRGDWRPLVFTLLTSEPTDDWRGPREKILQRDKTKVSKVITVGCGPYIDVQLLRDIAIGETFNMNNDDMSFKALFEWTTQCEEERRTSTVIKPSIVDFGCIPPRTSPCVTVRIEGGPAKIEANNELIKVTPSEVGREPTDIEVTARNGSDGDLIWDNLHIKGDNGDIDIPIICLWDEVLSRSFEEPIHKRHIKKAMKRAEPEQEASASALNDVPIKDNSELTLNNGPAIPTITERTYAGQSCRSCGRNLRYDSDNKVWLKCDKCKGPRIIISVPQSVINDTKTGIKKDGKKLLKDLWEVIIGKQDWNLK